MKQQNFPFNTPTQSCTNNSKIFIKRLVYTKH